MKIRNGYVSNSSSSSFICDVSGRVESGYDMCIQDAEMYECVNGHTIDEEFITFDVKDVIKELLLNNNDTYKEYVKTSDDPTYYNERIKENLEILEKISDMDEEDIDDKFNDELSDIRYNLPAKFCPICQMKNTTDGDLISYLLKELGKKREDVEGEIKVKFDSFEDFKNNIK